MGENVRLCRPSIGLQNEYISYYEEWIKSGEELEGMAPWEISRDPADFHRMIESLLNNEKVEYLPRGGVPFSTYWLVTDSGRVVGSVNIRHSLTTFGHIGYGIRPSERRKGYATKLLALSLLKARELGIEKVLVICNKDNVGSKKTIRNNGGIQGSSYTDENGNVLLRFWIDL